MPDFPDLEALAAAVQAWSDAADIQPASGQVAEAVTVRSLRYYRTFGVLDGPLETGGYGEHHLLQVQAVRTLQALGQPLRRIQELLFGRKDAELRRVVDDGAAELARTRPRAVWPGPAAGAGGAESWQVTPLDTEWLLVSRRGRSLTAQQRERIQSILTSHPPFSTSTPRAR